MFDNIDLKSFWKESEYINKVCTGENLTDEMVQEAEKRLGVKLPKSYIELMKTQNGGKPNKNVWFDEKNRYRVDVEEFYSISVSVKLSTHRAKVIELELIILILRLFIFTTLRNLI